LVVQIRGLSRTLRHMLEWSLRLRLARAGGNKPKIPDVCDHFGVDCRNLWSVLRELGFSL